MSPFSPRRGAAIPSEAGSVSPTAARAQRGRASDRGREPERGGGATPERQAGGHAKRALLALLWLGMAACPRSEPENLPVPCSLPDGLMEAAAGARPSQLDFDAEGRVFVVVEATPDFSMPASCAEAQRAMGLIEAWCPPAELCALRAKEGVSRVRAPRTPSLK